MSKKKLKKLDLPSKIESKYEKIHQLIESAPNEFLRQKWKDALKALQERDKEDKSK